MPDEAPIVELLVAFGHELRSAGLAVGSGDVMTYCSAMASLDTTDLADLYWAGRTTMVTRRDQIPDYDRVFRRFFLDETDATSDTVRETIRAATPTMSVLEVPATEPAGPEAGDDEETSLGHMASDADIFRNKSFAACTPDELAAVRRIMKRIRLNPPRRSTRRTETAANGDRLDMRRMMRESMRAHGEPPELYRRHRRRRLRPLVLILDVSGSMSDYSRNLLQFAYSARRAASRVEVFCFGTRLTRITKALARRRPDDAMDEAAKTVFDWEGGTRIGDSLTTFVRDFGRRGMGRGAMVVICSDGLDRGDPAVLSSAMERLARQCHGVVWLNPHMAHAGREGRPTDVRPNTLGMMVAAPHVDLMLPGNDLRSLEEFAAVLPTMR
ncbi:MAG TPA: VWA domain-containing protein [Ilumatobacteraceae bacterium]